MQLNGRAIYRSSQEIEGQARPSWHKNILSCYSLAAPTLRLVLMQTTKDMVTLTFAATSVSTVPSSHCIPLYTCIQLVYVLIHILNTIFYFNSHLNLPHIAVGSDLYRSSATSTSGFSIYIFVRSTIPISPACGSFGDLPELDQDIRVCECI